MALIVQKFGGTSVADVTCMNRVIETILKTRAQGAQVVVVVSAMAGQTDALCALAQSHSALKPQREMDALLSTGEQVSTALLAMMLQDHGCLARSLTGAQLPILTDDNHTQADILAIDTRQIHACLEQGIVPIVAGFQGVNAAGDITTLGRGGSDTTAVALAAALHADACQIYTDVDGVYTVDPHRIADAKRFESLDFLSMRELAASGAKVLKTRSVDMAAQHHVPLQVLSSMQAASCGTWVDLKSRSETPRCALALRQDVIYSLRLPMSEQMAFIERCTQGGLEADMLSLEEGLLKLSFPRDRQEALSSWMARLPQEAVEKVYWSKFSLVTHAQSSSKILPMIQQALAQSDVHMHALIGTETKVCLWVDDKSTGALLQALVACLHLALEEKTSWQQEEDIVQPDACTESP